MLDSIFLCAYFVHQFVDRFFISSRAGSAQ